MIITRTPMRISFFGGGTDFPEFYKEHGGAVLSTTFDKYCYVNVRHLPRFFDYTSEFCYSKLERVQNTGEIQHPLIREAMRWFDMREIRLSYEADLPARTGLATSSSFAVGMLSAFHAMKGQYVGKKQLADEAIHLERELCGEAGGWQDQIAVSYGGLNRIVFSSEGYDVNPVIIHPERKKELNGYLMLFFTGFSRNSFDIQNKTRKSLKDKTTDLIEMKQMVDEAAVILSDKKRSLREFGELLDASWKLKRGINRDISTDYVDQMYQAARNAGAVGGKLLGAGGGGFMLFYVEKERQQEVRDALHNSLYVPFKFEDKGSDIIYFNPEAYILD